MIILDLCSNKSIDSSLFWELNLLILSVIGHKTLWGFCVKQLRLWFISIKVCDAHSLKISINALKSSFYLFDLVKNLLLGLCHIFMYREVLCSLFLPCSWPPIEYTETKSWCRGESLASINNVCVLHCIERMHKNRFLCLIINVIGLRYAAVTLRWGLQDR